MGPARARPETARRVRAGVALAGLLLAAPLLLAGCPRDACILKVCTNGNCRCSISSCGEGAGFDTRQNRCRCLKGRIPLGGQCLTAEEADAYCGVGHHFENGGCAQDRCKPGDEIDQRTGWCVPREQVASNLGVSVGAGQQLGCPPGQKLIVDGKSAACVPLSQTCARDETWNGAACVKIVQCPTGSIWDTSVGQCVQYAQGGDELTVNVSQWAQSNYGPNGGAGTSAFCGAFAKKPLSFGISEGSTAFVRATVTMSFPEGEIARGAVQTSAVFDASGNAVPPSGAAEVDAAAKGIFSTLVLGGGRANAPSASTTVKCAVIHASKPQPVPAVGGL